MKVERSLTLLLDRFRARVAKSASSPFGHAPYPLVQTLDYQGDKGLLGPDSISWMLIGDVAAFVGGIRSLLIQAAHPEVVAGVGDHSRYRDDPLGRLSRTSAYVTATTYGAMPEVEEAVERVRRAHRIVSGVSDRGLDYSATDGALSAWVHNALTDSFLAAHQAFGAKQLSRSDADQFVSEQTRVGALLGADPMPTRAGDLGKWVAEHPDLAPSRAMREAIEFLSDPPLELGLRLGYKVLLHAATATIPRRLTSMLGLPPAIAGMATGRAAVGTLRWALGFSPTWRLALIRSGAPVPEELFRQPLRVA